MGRLAILVGVITAALCGVKGPPRPPRQPSAVTVADAGPAADAGPGD